jgi:hypothetical protein
MNQAKYEARYTEDDGWAVWIGDELIHLATSEYSAKWSAKALNQGSGKPTKMPSPDSDVMKMLNRAKDSRV